MLLYSLFAEILGYPARPITRAVAGCAAQLAVECREASIHLAEFETATAGMNPGQLQESYINAFDLRPDCTPNLGYHLFGDDGRRGLFLAELKGRIESAGIASGSELPDHISVLLRYMHQDEQECRILIEDCVLPAVSRMAEVLDSSDNPYRHALHALLTLLQQQNEAPSEMAEGAKV